MTFGDDFTYGSSGSCNNSVAAEYSLLNTSAGGGGPSGCATGTPAASRASSAGRARDIQAFMAIRSWQSERQRAGLPDVSLFAANGIWGHYYVFCDSDPSEAEHCTGPPSEWLGAGGTSFAAPIMAGIQSLVNQYTASNQGNPNPTYYSLAQTEYGASRCVVLQLHTRRRRRQLVHFLRRDRGRHGRAMHGLTQLLLAPSGTYGVLSTSTSALQASVRKQTRAGTLRPESGR